MSAPTAIKVCVLAMMAAIILPTVQAQTQLDPARAAAATRQDVTAEALVRAQQQASSAGIDAMNDYAPVSPGDSDIGQQLILKRNEKNYPFAAWLDSSVYWTDNAANVHEGNTEDWFFVGGVNLAWQQRLGSRYYGDVYAGQHWYRYNDLTDLDYESGEASIGGLVVFPELANSIFHLHYYYQRITQGIEESPIYETHNIRVGMQKTFLINRINSVNVNAMSSFALETDPNILRRHEHSLSLGYNLRVMHDWTFSLSYRLAYYDYFNLEGRQDWYHNFGAAITWRPKEYFEASLGYYYTLNRSNYEAFTYDSQLAGPTLAVKYKF